VNAPTPDQYFDEQWGHSDDPWDQSERRSELRKFDLTAALPRPTRSRRVFEPGSATGLLTERLAGRCDEVVAGDRHDRAVEVSRRRLAHLPNVTVSRWRIPDDWPDGTFDLVVFSEVLYYLDPPALERCVDLAVAGLDPGGELVAVHYRPVVADHRLTGDEVHGRLRNRTDLVRWSTHVEDDFVLEGFAVR